MMIIPRFSFVFEYSLIYNLFVSWVNRRNYGRFFFFFNRSFLLYIIFYFLLFFVFLKLRCLFCRGRNLVKNWKEKKTTIALLFMRKTKKLVYWPSGNRPLTFFFFYSFFRLLRCYIAFEPRRNFRSDELKIFYMPGKIPIK